ncbi:MAG TPA: ComEA family DNA-binding protein [Longimicrobiales bacterium]|nr:ComEA family DNA-binding protein [Longimicrobiales bacterium]
MSEAETRALGRAAVLLLVASFARWGWVALGPEAPAAPQGVSSDLLEESRALAKGEEERRRPLGSSERLDPNTAPEEALDRLPGVGVATARAIVRSREVDGPFRSPGDLSRIKGIGPAAVSRMAPHLDFSVPPSTVPAPKRSAGRASTPAGPAPVDVNRAPPAALETLPGVGPVLAARIVAARSQTPFSSVEDLARVPGIGPATVARLRPFVIAKP